MIVHPRIRAMRSIFVTTGLAGLLWACAAGCGGTSAQSWRPVSATSAGDVYTLKMGALQMVVDASAGARVTEFSLDGANVLTGSDLSTLNYGSTYWPSPQSSWCASTGGCWPPI